MNKKRLLKYILVSLLILLFVVSLGYNARNYIKETLVETYNNGYRIGVNDIATNIKNGTEDGKEFKISFSEGDIISLIRLNNNNND